MPPFNEVEKVKYGDNLPTFSLHELTDARMREALLKIVTTKSAVWEYEEEYRLIHQEGYNNKPQRIPANSIKAIYFGARCRQGDIETICRLTHQLGVEYFKARLSSDKFGLKFDPLPYNESQAAGSYPLSLIHI